jgi:hypothetical protein
MLSRDNSDRLVCRPVKLVKKKAGGGGGERERTFSWCQIGTNNPQAYNKLMYLYNNEKLSFFFKGIVK